MQSELLVVSAFLPVCPWDEGVVPCLAVPCGNPHPIHPSIRTHGRTGPLLHTKLTRDHRSVGTTTSNDSCFNILKIVYMYICGYLQGTPMHHACICYLETGWLLDRSFLQLLLDLLLSATALQIYNAKTISRRTVVEFPLPRAPSPLPVCLFTNNLKHAPGWAAFPLSMHATVINWISQYSWQGRS